MSTTFLLTTLVIVATPGTGVLYTLAAALSRGQRASLLAAVGCTLGIVPHLLAAMTGLAAIVQASGVAFEVVRSLGVAYLLYMAISTFRDRSALTAEPAAPQAATGVIVKGVLVNLLNPKLTLFFVAFLPQFADPARPAQMLALGGLFMLVTLVIFALYGALAAAVRDRVLQRPAVTLWLRRAFGTAFAGLAGRLALTDR